MVAGVRSLSPLIFPQLPAPFKVTFDPFGIRTKHRDDKDVMVLLDQIEDIIERRAVNNMTLCLSGIDFTPLSKVYIYEPKADVNKINLERLIAAYDFYLNPNCDQYPLRSTQFTGSDLRGVSLQGAHISSGFYKANLKGANFQGAFTSDFREANGILTGVKLRDHLKESSGAIIDETTKF